MGAALAATPIAPETVFPRIIADHSLPFLAALDPFRLSVAEIAERIRVLESLGGSAVLLASTDDERYELVVPTAIRELQSFSDRTMIIEHFRPKRGLGFRRVNEKSAVMMTRVLSAQDEYFRNCRSIELVGDVSGTSCADRLRERVVLSAAVVFGADAKSLKYVSAYPVDETNRFSLNMLLAQALQEPLDLLYLFSRHARLSAETVAEVRATVGPHLPVIASGCIRSPADIAELRDAGASIVVVGSLLETPNWRSAIELLARGR